MGPSNLEYLSLFIYLFLSSLLLGYVSPPMIFYAVVLHTRHELGTGNHFFCLLVILGE